MAATTSQNGMYETATSATLADILAVIAANTSNPSDVINVFHDGTNYVAIYRKRIAY